MQSTAVAQSSDRSTSKQGKTPRIPKHIVRACELLASGECKTITAAAERVGITREWLGKMLGRSHIRAFMTRRARENIEAGVWRASARLVELIDADSEHVAAKVSERILTSEGILKSDASQVSVAVGVSVGYVIDLSGQSQAPTITVSHEGDA